MVNYIVNGNGSSAKLARESLTNEIGGINKILKKNKGVTLGKPNNIEFILTTEKNREFSGNNDFSKLLSSIGKSKDLVIKGYGVRNTYNVSDEQLMILRDKVEPTAYGNNQENSFSLFINPLLLK